MALSQRYVILELGCLKARSEARYFIFYTLLLMWKLLAVIILTFTFMLMIDNYFYLLRVLINCLILSSLHGRRNQGMGAREARKNEGERERLPQEPHSCPTILS